VNEFLGEKKKKKRTLKKNRIEADPKSRDPI
jgi:hypothetical protein